jgi:allophanate hydrolase
MNLHTPPGFTMTLKGLAAAYADGLSPQDVIATVLDRLAAVDDPAIFLHLAEADALMAEARALGRHDPARPLWGVPFAVKDNIDVAGMPTTAACPAFAYTAERDAFVVARLRAAGAIPIGKTNLDQFATGLVGVRSPYGVPRNALDPEIVPGGSSSGSAVAVAQGIVPFALGTDTAGSGRVPAALNGIVGLKPTLGALSATGLVPACRTLDTISVFAHSVGEAYDVLRAAAAFDAEDAFSRPLAVPPMPAPLPAPRIVAPDAGSLVVCGDTVQAADFEATLSRLAASGARVERVDFAPFFDVANMLYEGAWVAERYAAIETMMSTAPDAIHPVTRAIIAKAEALSAVDAFRGLYRLEELRRAVAPILEGADMLCVPSIPTFYSRADLEADPVTPNSNLGTYTNFVNLLDLCALAVPTGPRSDGRPGSVTLIARAGRDGLLAAEGARLADGRALPPAEVGPDETILAVCGAHMAGLPLNRPLTDRGARFLRAAQTAEGYRLFALPGGPPERPGLVRDAAGAGRIGLELWALPTAEVGGVLRTVPSPLAIGTIRLEDGGSAQGFLCETAATPDATDITAHGGWRAWLQDRQPADA